MALGGEDVSMRALDLANEAVSSQESDLPADLGREPSLGRSGGFATDGVKDPLEVAIAKASGGELAAGDRLEDRQVGGIADSEL
jgi:hypothetical protein